MEISFYEQWVNSGRPYKAGVEFYLLHGNNSTLQDLFEEDETDFTRTKLNDELQKLRIIKTIIHNPAKKILPETLPEHLKIEFEKQGDRIREIAHLQSQLELLPTDKARFKAAERIIYLTEQRRSVFQKIDFYNESGQILSKKDLPGPPADNLETLQLKQELILLRSQRTKLKSNPVRIKDYNKVVDRIDEIKQLLR